MTVVRSESDESKTTIVLFMNIYIAMYNLLYTWDEKAIKHFERRLGYVNLLHSFLTCHCGSSKDLSTW